MPIAKRDGMSDEGYDRGAKRSWLWPSGDKPEWPNDAFPSEIETPPKWVIPLAVFVVALMVTYATYVFFTT